MAKVNLGQVVKDTLSRYTGIADARTEWLNGCVRIRVISRELQDGKPVDEWFDADQLEVIDADADANANSGLSILIGLTSRTWRPIFPSLVPVLPVGPGGTGRWKGSRAEP